ncbi:MAG: hypothetical protein ACWGOX_02505 [Desulforhopalus sp.]
MNGNVSVFQQTLMVQVILPLWLMARAVSSGEIIIHLPMAGTMAKENIFTWNSARKRFKS